MDPAGDNGGQVDALSDVLRVAGLTGGVFLHAEFSHPWCLAAQVSPEMCTPALGTAPHLIPYHYVVEGELRLRVAGEGGAPSKLRGGEGVVLPRNDLHHMGSDLSLQPVSGREIIRLP